MNELLKSIRNLCYSIFELTIAIVFLSIIFRQVEFNTLEKSVFFVGLVSMAIYFVIGLILKLKNIYANNMEKLLEIGLNEDEIRYIMDIEENINNDIFKDYLQTLNYFKLL